MAGKGCSCSRSAANAGISQALVLLMSDTLTKLDGSPSAARAVTFTVLRLAPLALAVEPVRCGIDIEKWVLSFKYVVHLCSASLQCDGQHSCPLMGRVRARRPNLPVFLAEGTLYSRKRSGAAAQLTAS